MFVVIFHMLYLLGKYVYDNYREKRANTPSNDDTGGEMTNSRYTLDDKVEVAVNSAQPLSSELTIVKFSPPAYIQRYLAVSNVLSDPKYGAKLRKIVDFGCSELGFLPYLKSLVGVEEILFVDVDRQILESNKTKAAPLIVDHLLERQTELKIEICEGSVIHNDKKLEKTDAVVCIELIEHLYTPVLLDVPINIFGYIKPKLVIITTPNADFNVLFPNLVGFRHPDHKFEWTRRQFENWAKEIVKKYPHYSVRFQGICYGPESTTYLGACSQMAIFELNQEPNTMSLEVGVEGLFRTIETYIYPFIVDDRSDSRKVLDEVSYYVNFLTHENEEPSNEIDLMKLCLLMKKYPISLEILRDIMSEDGYVIQDRENGPVVLLPEENDPEMDEMDEVYSLGDTYIGDHFSDEDEDELAEMYSINRDFTYESNNWNEESIVIAANQVISNHENSYLFDGEHSTNHYHTSPNWIADVHTVDVPVTVAHTANATDASTIVSNREAPFFYQEVVPSDCDPCASNTTEANNVDETDDSITPNIKSSSLQAVLQDVSTNLSTIQDNGDAISSFQPYLSVSRSSTSPGLLFSPELDDSLISQNLLNSTFHRSEILNEAATNVKFSAEASSMNETLILKEKDEVGFSDHSPLCYLEGNLHNIEQNNVDSMKHREDIPNNEMIEMEVQNVFSVIYDKPQSTSSPRCNKLRTTHIVNVNQIVSTQENSLLNDEENSTDHHSSEELTVVSDVNIRFPKCNNTKEPIIIKQSCLEGDDLISALESYTELVPTEAINTVVSYALKNTSQKSSCSDNIITETINHQTSDNKNVISKCEIDTNCSSSNNSQRELCLGSKIVDSDNDHFTSIGSLQDGDEKTAGKKNLIKHETDDIVDVQRVDTHCVFLSNDVHEDVCCKSKTSVIKPCDNHTGTCLQNESKGFAHPSISGKNLSSFRELSNTKSWSTSSECSSVHAKENSLNDSFKSCDEDINNKVVQFAPPLRSDEDVRCDTKDFTNKDVNTSNIAGLIASAEAKLPSPIFESPPDSWSHEIVDSGYPNSASGQDITPENDLSSIAQDHIPDTESPSVAEAPRLGVLEPIEVENGDLANNNRDDEGNNMMAADAANDIEGLQPLIDVLENDLENENDIYALENGFPIWLLRILDMANPLDFDVQPRQNLRAHHEIADVDYMDDEGFDSSSSDE